MKLAPAGSSSKSSTPVSATAPLLEMVISYFVGTLRRAFCGRVTATFSFGSWTRTFRGRGRRGGGRRRRLRRRRSDARTHRLAVFKLHARSHVNVTGVRRLKRQQEFLGRARL